MLKYNRITNEPKVSIIMPCYNDEKYIAAAIESILNQIYKNIELIIIDDCSTDSSWSIITKYAKYDSRIIAVKNEVNYKLIRTLNRGIDIASGEYIGRMDSDDISHCDRINEQIIVLQKCDVDIVSVFPNRIDKNDKFYSRQRSFVCTNSASAKFVVCFEPPILHAGIIAKASILKNNKYNNKYEYEHIEDYEMWYRLFIKQDIKYIGINKCLYNYRVNANSVSKKYSKIQVINHIKMSQRIIKEYLEYNISERALLLMLFPNNIYDIQAGEISSTIGIIKCLYSKYLSINKDINNATKKEINNWLQQRIIRTCLHFVINNTITIKIEALKQLREEYSAIFKPITYNNAISIYQDMTRR